MIQQLGTEEQIRGLAEYMSRQDTRVGGQSYNVENQNEYRSQFREAPPEKKVDHFTGLLSHMRRSRLSTKKRPEEISLADVRRWLWWAYAQIVKQETGIDLVKRLEKGKAVLTDPQAEALKNMAYWLLGDNSGPWPVDKSLIFMGPKGTGKTTIIQAGAEVMTYIKTLTGWDSRLYQLQSFEQLFLDFKATESLSGLQPISRGWWAFDDLKARHAQYKHYGETLPLLSLVFLARHSAWKFSGDQTIIATNLTADDFKDLKEVEYDKLMIQYYIVPLEGENLRHPKHRLT